MPTKTKTRAAQAAANTQEKPTLGIPTPKQEPFLFGIQESIADSVAEMLTTGSSSRNIELLAHIVVDHDWRRRFENGPGNCEYTQNAVRRIVDELAVARTAGKRLDADERPKPSDLVGRIRERAREMCASNLQQFLDQANPEQLRLMNEVMVDYRSAHDNDRPYGELGIASALMEQIDSNVNYVRVPAPLLADVENYIHALIKAYPGKEAA